MRKRLLIPIVLIIVLLLFGCAPPGYTIGEDGQLSPADAGGQQAGDTADAPLDSADAGVGQNDADTNSGSQAEDAGDEPGEPMDFSDDLAENTDDSGGDHGGEAYDWTEELCSGDWHYIKTIDDGEIEVTGTEFEDITPDGTRVYTFFTEGIQVSKGYDSSGESLWHHEHTYYVSESMDLVYVRIQELLDHYRGYEFDGTAYEVYIDYVLIDGYLYESVYLKDQDDAFHLASNTSVYSKDENDEGP